MQLEHYLIDQSGKDWSDLLSPWAAILPARFTIFLVNRFGDAFMIYDDRTVHLLDVGACTVTQIAENRDDLAGKMDDDDIANDWLLIPLVDACVQAGMVPSNTECYGYRIPPILGGEYQIENVALISLAEHYSFLADIHRQTKDLPDGNKIKIAIKRTDADAAP